MSRRLCPFSSRAGLLAGSAWLVLGPAWAAQPPGGPQVVSDLALATSGSRTTLYAADPESGSIYVAEWGDKAPDEIPFARLRPFFSSPQLPRPTALAVAGSRLIVCDGKSARVFAVDRATRASEEIPTAGRLGAPRGLAASEDGDLIVADEKKGLVWIPAGGEPEVLLTEDEIEPQSVHMMGRTVLVLDDDSDQILSLPDPSRRAAQKHWAPRTLDLDLGTFEIEDFAVYRGVYYLTDGRRLRLSVPSSRLSMAAPLSLRDETGRLGSLAAGPLALVAADEDRRVVRVIPRLVPLSVSLEAGPVASSEGLAAFYEYLYERKILPTQPRSAAADSTLGGMLLDHGVALAPLTVVPPSQQQAAAEARARMSKLICRLNARRCGRAKGGFTFATPIEAGESLVLPRLTIRSTLAASPVYLGGRPVARHLEERIPSAEERRKVTAEDLARLNIRVAATFDLFLAKKGLIAAPPQGDGPAPGLFLADDGAGTPRVVDLGCRSVLGPSVDRTEIYVPEGLYGHTAYLPGGQTASEWLAEIDRVEFAFARPSLERLAPEAWPEAARCAVPGAGTAVSLITQAFRAEAVRYRLLRADASLVVLDDEEIRRLGLRGHADPDGHWSLILDEPVYLGYQLASSREGGESAYTAQRLAVDPKSAAGIFQRGDGVLYLPLTRWQTDAVAPAADLANGESALRRLEKAVRGFHVLSTEALAVRAAGPVPGPPPQDPPDGAADVDQVLDQARAALSRAIAYEPALAEAVEELIGVAENARTVDTKHPALRDVFANPGPTVLEASDAVSAPAIRKYGAQDHGTHVSGLLAARGEAASRGLVPRSTLYLIDTGSERELHRSVEEAIDRQVFVFNFSFTLGRDDSLDVLKQRLMRHWADRLFVVAAGNDGKNLESSAEVAPAVWSEDLPNVLTVAAGDTDATGVLGDWTDDEGVAHKGSNFGRRHVQLVAPGLRIFSLARENGYAHATGSSQAVPQVTAAASMLAAQFPYQPSQLKARLIYTADWFSTLEDDVWGGRLNVKRAVWQPNSTLLTTQSDDTWRSLKLPAAADATLRVRDGTPYERRDESPSPPDEISVKSLLRVSRLASRRFRVFYLDADGKLRILHEAVLDGRIPCSSLLAWDKETRSFSASSEETAAECAQGLDVGQLQEYVGKIPATVRF